MEVSDKRIKEYDFRSPKKITKETISMLKGIYENYCRILTSKLTAMLRLMCDVTVEQVEESVFYEYNNALDDYVLMGLVDVKYPDDVISDTQILVEVSRPLSFVMIDRLLGGSGEEYINLRDYTDIELSLLSNVLRQLLALMGTIWEGTLDIETNLAKIETNSRFVQSINYNDTVVVIVLSVTINNVSGKVTICIPSEIIDEIFKKSNIYSKNIPKKSEQNIQEQQTAIMDSIKQSDLVITGVLGNAEVTLNDILNMQEGDLVMLNKKVDSNVSIYIESDKWFEGKWGIKNNKGAVKINKITH